MTSFQAVMITGATRVDRSATLKRDISEAIGVEKKCSMKDAIHQRRDAGLTGKSYSLESMSCMPKLAQYDEWINPECREEKAYM